MCKDEPRYNIRIIDCRKSVQDYDNVSNIIVANKQLTFTQNDKVRGRIEWNFNYTYIENFRLLEIRKEDGKQ